MGPSEIKFIKSLKGFQSRKVKFHILFKLFFCHRHLLQRRIFALCTLCSQWRAIKKKKKKLETSEGQTANKSQQNKNKWITTPTAATFKHFQRQVVCLWWWYKYVAPAPATSSTHQVQAKYGSFMQWIRGISACPIPTTKSYNWK